MKSARPAHRCTECGYASAKWVGRCPECQAWGSIQEFGAPAAALRAVAGEIEIPADSAVFVDGEAATITLTGLDESLTVAQPLELTLTFENAGEVTLPVTVANPDEALDRGEAFDFHHEEGTEEENEGEQREGGE